MRNVFIVVVLGALSLPCTVGSQQRTNRSPLNGEWRCVRVEKQDGHTPALMIKSIGFEGAAFTVRDNGIPISGPFDVDPNSDPPRINLCAPVSRKVHFAGIYRFDADTLVICFWQKAAERQATFELQKQNPPGVVYTFRRAAFQKQ